MGHDFDFGFGPVLEKVLGGVGHNIHSHEEEEDRHGKAGENFNSL